MTTFARVNGVLVEVTAMARTTAPASGGDVTAPAAPTGLVATAGTGQVSLDWDDNGEADFSHYNVYRDTSTGVGTGGVPIAQPSSSAFTDTNVTAATEYFYVVTAVDTSGNESSASAEDSATPTAASTTLVEDTFDDSADTDLTAHTPDTDSVGNGWQVNNDSVFLITGDSQVELDTRGGSYALAWVDSGQGDVVLTVAGVFGGGGPHAQNERGGVCFRVQDQSNYFRTYVRHSSHSGQSHLASELFLAEAGVETELDDHDLLSGTDSVSAPRQMTIRVTLSGTSITIEYDLEDGAGFVTAHSLTNSTFQTEGNHGLSARDFCAWDFITVEDNS